MIPLSCHHRLNHIIADGRMSWTKYPRIHLSATIFAMIASIAYLPQIEEWDDGGQVAGEELKDGEDSV